MQAQSVQVRRNVRIPWVWLLVAALLIVALAIGAGVAVSNRDATTSPPRLISIDPAQISGPTAYPGFVPSVALARLEHQKSETR